MPGLHIERHFLQTPADQTIGSEALYPAWRSSRGDLCGEPFSNGHQPTTATLNERDVFPVIRCSGGQGSIVETLRIAGRHGRHVLRSAAFPGRLSPGAAGTE
jgi:hypothetical protein